MMIGNAVPVNLAKFVADALMRHILDGRRRVGNDDLFRNVAECHLEYSRLDLSGKEVEGKVSTLKPDLIVGDPLCQDYSIAGNRNLGGEG